MRGATEDARVIVGIVDGSPLSARREASVRGIECSVLERGRHTYLIADRVYLVEITKWWMTGGIVRTLPTEEARARKVIQ